MPSVASPLRRQILGSSAGVTAALLGLGATGCQSPSAGDRQLRFASLAAAQEELARLSAAKRLSSSASWTWAQTLVHCAQSIEFSMSGYPQLKSSLFQNTIGSAAVQLFTWRGRMSHDLSEPIPGAPGIEANTDVAQALERLSRSISGFRQWSGPLMPHFAYGALDKNAYELAHAMHLANHLSAFSPES